jgi:ligand-binding SRPBCC domain-containing protein
MTLHVLERSIVVPGTLEDIFDFFMRPENLKELTPPWLNLTIVWSSDEQIRAGSLIRYRMRWIGLPMVWESAIVQYRRNETFTDEMLRGPYAVWRHRHGFRQTGGGVELSDRVEYALPLGPLGTFAHGLFVRRQLEAIFRYREKRARALFPGP